MPLILSYKKYEIRVTTNQIRSATSSRFNVIKFLAISL